MDELGILLVLCYWLVACMVFILSGVQGWMEAGADAWSWRAIGLRLLLSVFWIPAKIAHWVLRDLWWD